MRQLVSTALATALVLSPLLAARAQDAVEPRLKSLMKKRSRPAKAPAASQIGSAKEDDPEDAGATAGTATAASISDADLSLMRGVLYAFEPAPREIRVIAVEDLALLGDARALNPLAHLILDPDPAVALAATRAVARFPHPRAEEILGNVIRHPNLSQVLKVAAIRGLPYQDSASARELLTSLSNDRQWAVPLRQAAQAVLAEMVK